MINYVLRSIAIPALCLSLLVSCDRAEKTAPPAVPPPAPKELKTVFTDPIEPARYEVPSGAVATWRDFAAHKPKLVLFANHPLLQPLPADDLATIRGLLRDGSHDEIVRRGRYLAADTAFLPPHAVSVAIDAGCFSEIIFVRPSRKSRDEISLEKFLQEARSAGFISEAESRSFRLSDGVISGTLRNIPFRAAHPDAIPPIDGPALLHIDLGYFKELYLDEVKTPAYDLLYQTATTIRDTGLKALAVTLSFSNQEIGFSLDSRFVLTDFAEILRNPALLDGGTPPSWTLRASALFHSTMFHEEDSRELLRQAAQANPEDPGAWFALAIARFSQKDNNEAFAALERAVVLDPGYGLQYLELAERGLEINRKREAVELLRKAAVAIPDNDFIPLRLAGLLVELGATAEARPLIASLRQKPWSSAYHSGIPRLLEQMEEAARVDTVLPPGHDEKGS